MSEQAKLIYQCSKTKEGQALLSLIEDIAVRRFRGTAEEVQMQAGMFNLWLEVKGEIERGESESN